MTIQPIYSIHNSSFRFHGHTNNTDENKIYKLYVFVRITSQIIILYIYIY